MRKSAAPEIASESRPRARTPRAKPAPFSAAASGWAGSSRGRCCAARSWPARAISRSRCFEPRQPVVQQARARRRRLRRRRRRATRRRTGGGRFPARSDSRPDGSDIPAARKSALVLAASMRGAEVFELGLQIASCGLRLRRAPRATAPGRRRSPRARARRRRARACARGRRAALRGAPALRASATAESTSS